MLDLQLQVEVLRAPFGNGTVSLQDICYQPLAPDYTACTIQSILNYYQNDPKTLDRNISNHFYVTADYLDHFLYCVK